jgi:integrase
MNDATNVTKSAHKTHIGKKKKHSKGSKLYWQDRVHSVNGHNWNCFFMHRGERKHLSLPLPANEQKLSAQSRRAYAGDRAQEIYTFLKAHGWTETMAKFWPKTVDAKILGTTVGDFLQAVSKNVKMDNRTLTGYQTCLRRIVSDVFEISGGDRYDYKTGGRDAWVAKVHAVKLAALTPEKVQQWQIDYLNAAAPDPLSQRRAKTSCNTTLRQAKSLFSAHILSSIEGKVELPSPLPFSKVKFSERQSLKYQSDVDIDQLIQDAQSELMVKELESFKIFLLGTMAGLRRKEIDLLEWSSFKWDANEIEVKRTKHFEAKSEDSYGLIQVDPELMEAFRGYRAKATDFVIRSDWEPTSVSWNRYRCQPHFEKLALWLREKGIDDDKPIHVLRKEFGSRINANGDIHSASRALRHADISITSQFYADNRKRVTTGFGHLFKGESSNIVENVKFGTNAA